MNVIKPVVQRGFIAAKALVDREYRWGQRWRARGMQAAPPGLAAMQLAELNSLLSRFRAVEPVQQLRCLPVLALTDFSQLSELPLLTRQGMRELYPVLLKLYRGRRDVASYITSGATAEPAEFLLDRRLVRRAGGCNLGMYELLGWRPGMARLCLWGNPRDLGVADRQPTGVKARLLSWLEHTRRYGGFMPSAAMYRDFVAVVRARPGCAVFGYASLLENCARLMIEQGDLLPAGHLATVWTCAELLPPAGRELISRAFGCPVREHYGSRECSTIATECAAGNRHISPRYIAEVLDPDSGQPLAPGQAGSLVFTDLFNDVTPFIRYELGDLGSVEWRDCDCGARGPCLTSIVGRKTTLITLPSGHCVSSHVIAYLMRRIRRLERFQLNRLGPQEFECRYIGPAVPAEDLAAAVESFSEIFEGAELRFAAVRELDRSPSGKLIEYRDLTAE
jgi:phenylacetate-CoA ligase